MMFVSCRWLAFATTETSLPQIKTFRYMYFFIPVVGVELIEVLFIVIVLRHIGDHLCAQVIQP